MVDDIEVVADDTIYSDESAGGGEDLYVGEGSPDDSDLIEVAGDDLFAEDIDAGFYDDAVLPDDGEVFDWDFTFTGDETDDLVFWILPVEQLPPDGAEGDPAIDPAVCGIPEGLPVCDRTLDAAVLYADTSIL